VEGGRNGLYSLRLTRQLQAGDRLASCFARKLAAFGDRCPSPSAVGVSQGFTFGDGSHPQEAKKSARTPFYGAKKEMRRYFSSCRISDFEINGQLVPHALDLPRSWKDLPAADESLSFLYGWLSGYFAADGHVCRSGKQAILCSAREENLRFVKGICYQLGVRVSPIRPAVRRSDGCVPGAAGKPLFAVSFAVGDLPVEFWARSSHRKRVERWLAGAGGRVITHWTVASVVDRGEADEVYCAVVPGAEKFTLADNVLTMNCPYCGDRRRRLYVHHLWCTKDPFSGERMRHLATCYNEDCLHQHYADFEEKVFAWEANPRRRYPEMAVATPEIAESGELAEAELPGVCPSVADLPRTHRAVGYLAGRGFDVAALARHWDVRYCEEATTHREAEGRIIVPVRFGGRLVGWQGRHVGECDWKRERLAKYYNLPSFHKRRVLYNFDRASTRRCVVVVEGVSDAWKVGRNAVALLGKTFSHDQVELLQQWKAEHEGDVVVVLMLDPDARGGKSYERTVEGLREVVKARRRVEVSLPEGVDPGSLSRPVIWSQIDDRLAAAGLDPRVYR
jgi:DNA primase